MDKAFENMDKRFKNIEAELNYSYDSKLWNEAESLMGDTALDSAFTAAAGAASVSVVDFDGLDDAFMNDAFIEGADAAKNNYQASYFKEFKDSESALHQDSSFVDAAALSSVTYQSEYWNDANMALEKEGLHHEYKSDYWKEAEKLLLKESKTSFFYRWGAVATVLLLLSFVSIQLTQSSLISNELSVYGVNSKKNLLKENSESNMLSVMTEEMVTVPDEIVKTADGIVKTEGVLNTHVNENGLMSETVYNSNAGTNQNTHHIELKKDETLPDDQLSNRSGDNTVNSELETPIGIEKDEIVRLDRENEFYLSESMPASNLVLNTIEYNPMESKPNVLSVKIAKGLGNDFGLETNTICPRNSLYVDYRFSPIKRFDRISFGLDLGLYHMNLDNFEYEQNYSIYNLEGSVDHYWYKMTYKDLVYMSSSLNTYIDFGKASKLRLGLGLDHLLTSRIGMEFQESLEAEKMDVGTDWGLNRGINKFDLNFGLGYEFALNSKFSFLIDSKIGTVDKTNNNYLHDKKSHRDVSILFGLKYNIFAH